MRVASVIHIVVGPPIDGHPANVMSVSRCVRPRREGAVENAPPDSKRLVIAVSESTKAALLASDPDTEEARLLSFHRPLESGTLLGFELVNYDTGITHSLRCNVPDIAVVRDLGCTLNEHLLFKTEADAKTALARVRSAGLLLEDGLWIPVGVFSE